MQEADKGDAGELMGEGLRIGIVRARFNDAVTQRLGQACLSELDRLTTKLCYGPIGNPNYSPW